MKKIIEINHHLDDYECMWNGIEDLYIQNTGETLPPNFFFILAGFGSFCYMKTESAELKRMVALGDGRTKQMYQSLAPIVGFEYKHHEYKSFERALAKAKSEIDAGYPTVFGALDMYYLPYYTKLYEQQHIPFHYVLMVGYDDSKECIYLYDCGRKELESLSYNELSLAWNCSYPGLSNPNTLCTIRMNSTKDKFQIAKEALTQKADLFLNPPVGFVGQKGFQKFIDELPLWRNELSKADYDKLFTNMVTFFGTVPTVPNALLGIAEPDEISYYGGFDKMSRVLADLGNEQGNKELIKASVCFEKGAYVISKIKDIVVSYLIGNNDEMDKLPELFGEVLKIMQEGFHTIMYNNI